MKKGKKLITTLAISGMLCCGGLILGDIYHHDTNTAQNISISIDSYANNYNIANKNILLTSDNNSVLSLQNKTLENALKKLLGVTELKVNSISTHDKYMEKETEVGSGIYTADEVCLDLSNTGVRDITELCLFDWPSTLREINLAGNRITNEDLPAIMALTTYQANQEIDYLGTTLTCFSNFDQILATDAVSAGQGKLYARFNLCFNEIDLTSISQSYLDDTRFLYGIQKLNNLHSSGLVTKQELSGTYYYFRSNDYAYIHPSFWQTPNGQGRSISTYANDTVTNITANEKYGLYEISIIGDTGYFKGWSQSYEFTAFKANVTDDYYAEKLALFELPSNKLVFEGISPTWELSGSPVTNKVGNYKLNIVITTPTASRLIYVDYEVKDTTAPVIKLIGQDHMAIRETSVPFKDPGVKGYDSNEAEDISTRVKSNAQEVFEIVDGKYVKKTYVITYTLTDLAGNVATPITRTVTVQENVLDAINIKNLTEKDKIQTNKDIVLEVKPDGNINLDKYKDLQYFWYIDGKLHNEITIGDKHDGKSTMTFFFDSIGAREIKVVLKAKDINGNPVEVYSEIFHLNIQPSLRNNDTLILAAAITVGVILIIILTITIVKYRKAHAKSHKKTSAYHKKDKKSSGGGNEIKVIKDYKNSGNGGNSNFKPDKSQDKSNTQSKDGK